MGCLPLPTICHATSGIMTIMANVGTRITCGRMNRHNMIWQHAGFGKTTSCFGQPQTWLCTSLCCQDMVMSPTSTGLQKGRPKMDDMQQTMMTMTQKANLNSFVWFRAFSSSSAQIISPYFTHLRPRAVSKLRASDDSKRLKNIGNN